MCCASRGSSRLLISSTARGRMRCAVSSRALSNASFNSCCTTSQAPTVAPPRARSYPASNRGRGVFAGLTTTSYGHQPVTHAAHGFNQVAPEFFTQATDIDLDGVALDFGAKGIQAFFELRLRQQRAGALDKGFEQRPFPSRQIHGRAAALHRAFVFNDTQTTE